MPEIFQTTRRIEFSDTDAAAIVHFARFFYFMEIAEHELLRSLDFSVMQAIPEGHITWPRVSATCDYSRPARFEDILSIEVNVLRLGEKSVTYRHRFTWNEQLVATGKVTAVCCRLAPNGLPRSQPIPAEIKQKLARFLIDA